MLIVITLNMCHPNATIEVNGKEDLATSDCVCTDSNRFQDQFIGGFGLFMRFIDNNKNVKCFVLKDPAEL